jgi:hypothetical protein
MLTAIPRVIKDHVIYRTLWSYYLYEKYAYNRYRKLEPDEFITTAAHKKVSINGLVGELEKQGIAVIPSYFDEAWVDEVYRQLLALNEEVASGKIQAEPTGNLFTGRLNWSVPLRNQGIVRIHNVEQRVPATARFKDEPALRRIGELYLGRGLVNRVMLSQYNDPVPQGCRGYHLDSHHNQYKAFVYLNDVTEGNGPHNYLLGSHRITWDNMKRAHRTFRTRNTSISDEEALRTNFPNGAFPGKKGTVLLVDTRGIHQGANLKGGHRLVLMNYYYLASDNPTYS